MGELTQYRLFLSNVTCQMLRCNPHLLARWPFPHPHEARLEAKTLMPAYGRKAGVADEKEKLPGAT